MNLFDGDLTGFSLQNVPTNGRLFIEHFVEFGSQLNLFAYDASGNFYVGIPNAQANSGTNQIVLNNGTAPTASNGYPRVWAQAGEIHMMDGSNNDTIVSPHNLDQIDIDAEDPYPIAVRHKNRHIGIDQTIYLSKLARLVEQLTGEQLIWTEDIPQSDVVDFETAENASVAAVNAEIERHDALLGKIAELPQAEYREALRDIGARPEPYQKQQLKKWVKDRVKDKGKP